MYLLQVIDETLSPTWDEMLIFNEVVMYGNMEEIKDEPPTIVIEIFDQDRVVSFVYDELVSNLEVNDFLPQMSNQFWSEYISEEASFFAVHNTYWNIFPSIWATLNSIAQGIFHRICFN